MSETTHSGSTAGFTSLRVERPAPGVAWIVLDDPAMRNAMSAEMTSSWVRAVDELAADATVRVVVVTGEGSAFCSGGNTDWLASHTGSPMEIRDQMLPFYRSWLSIRKLEVPTIAAINGPAIGAGLAVALACDIRYAARGARMGVPFLKLGIHPGMATTYLLPDIIGAAAARDLLLTGRLVDADEALALGLVSKVSEPETFQDDVLAIARGVAGTAPIASRLTKTALARGHASVEACLDWEALAQPLTLATEDVQEGIAAVRDKRAPAFRGR